MKQPSKMQATSNEYYKTAYHKTCWLGCHKEIKAKNRALQRASKGTKVNRPDHLQRLSQPGRR
jgi:hypothetical protein